MTNCNPNDEHIRDAIKALETIQRSGAVSITTDGETVSYDLSAVRQTLAELRQQDPQYIACGSTRPRMWQPIFGSGR